MSAADRAAIVAEARAWIGTPYRHQASARGAGADCLGLVRGVWRATHGDEPETPPPYTPDWGERAPDEPLLAAAGRWLRPVEDEERPGDVLLFRMDARGPVKHCGVLVDTNRFVHAYSGRAVCETSLARWWRERLAAVFSFPHLTD